MSDISNQLIKNSYDYVLQSDLTTGIVYRIGGAVPVNPIFLSGLTINSGFTYSDGTEQPGYVLTCDALGNASWGPASAISVSALTYYVSASTPTGVALQSGDRWFDTSTGDELVWINDGDSTQWIQICCGSGGGGGNDTYVTGFTINGNNIVLTQNRTDAYSAFTISLSGITGGTSGDYLPLSGGTVTGDTIFQSGLTATTISATTYQNLPLSGVTNGTGITSTTSNGSVTITNTAPDQIVTISGGTGITTGGTYPNFTITNSSPDQMVTITGGTNIQINGSYPNFGINFTGQTSFPYLPLSGGTMIGETIFQSGLTANTISATTYQNLPFSGTVTGGGTTNYVPKWTGSTGLGNSQIFDNGTNVGIGTTSPSAKLDVNITGGTIGVRISGDSSSDMLRLTQTGSGNAILVEDSSNPDSTPFVVDATGKVGIGTTVPSYFLEAISTGGVDAVMMFDGGTAANANLIARADTTQKLPVVVMSDRNNVYGVNTSFYIGLDRSPSSLYAGRNDSIYVNNYTDKGHYFVTANSGGTKAIKMSIIGSGNVGIGTATPSEKLHVSGNTIISGTLTATTISATTYQNLPVSGVTGGTGISASTSGGLVTITNTAPDQIVTISSGTDISVTGTYPNFTVEYTGTAGNPGTTLIASNSCTIPADSTTYHGATIGGWGFFNWDTGVKGVISPSLVNLGIPLPENLRGGDTISVCGIAFSDATEPDSDNFDVSLDFFQCTNYSIIPLGDVSYLYGTDGVVCFNLYIELDRNLNACDTFLLLGFTSTTSDATQIKISYSIKTPGTNRV